MGEAKRRKQLDAQYGKGELVIDDSLKQIPDVGIQLLENHINKVRRTVIGKMFKGRLNITRSPGTCYYFDVDYPVFKGDSTTLPKALNELIGTITAYAEDDQLILMQKINGILKVFDQGDYVTLEEYIEKIEIQKSILLNHKGVVSRDKAEDLEYIADLQLMASRYNEAFSEFPDGTILNHYDPEVDVHVTLLLKF